MMSEIEDEVMVKPTNRSNKTVDAPHSHNPLPHTLTFSEALCEDISYLTVLKKMVFAASETNHERIESIKQDIATGRYQINSHQIAAHLFAT